MTLLPKPASDSSLHKTRVGVFVLASAFALLSACSEHSSHTDMDHESGVHSGGAQGTIGIITLSNRHDLISGGDAVVEITVPEGVTAPLQVSVNGRDVSNAFAERADGRIKGLLTGLQDGDNRVHAMAGSRAAVRYFPGRRLNPGSVLR
jgi:hypothetical protein